MPPVGKVYLPDCSYREMTEWALPTEQLVEYERITHEMHGDARLAALRRFVGGGFWRNFKLKYPEADEMYCRMMMVSRRLQEAIDDGAAGQARRAGPHAALPGAVQLRPLARGLRRHLPAAPPQRGLSLA